MTAWRMVGASTLRPTVPVTPMYSWRIEHTVGVSKKVCHPRLWTVGELSIQCAWVKKSVTPAYGQLEN